MKIPIKIDETVTLTKEGNEYRGLVVKLQYDLYLIFKKRREEYGFYLINPWNGERGHTKWGLTEPQCSRLINQVLEKPKYGFGKEERRIRKELIKITNKIKQTYVKHKLPENNSSSKGNSKRSAQNGTHFKKNDKNCKPRNRKNNNKGFN
ncbi:MAG: hypothetical protein WCX46_02375 [Candidatus Paceibacterota bacterium]|jgi:hypothetical protein